MRTFAPVKPFYLFLLLLLLLFFRHLKITLDSEQPSWSKNRSFRQSEVEYDVLNISKEICILLIIVHSICEVILCPAVRVKGGMSLRNDIIMRNVKYGEWHKEIN